MLRGFDRFLISFRMRDNIIWWSGYTFLEIKSLMYACILFYFFPLMHKPGEDGAFAGSEFPDLSFWFCFF